MANLNGQIALVTGAARGLGRTYAEALAAEGVNVVACDRLEAVNELEGLTYVADVSQPADVKRVVDGAMAEHGRIDILVNNAGTVYPTGAVDPWEQSLADWDEIVGTNAKGPFMFGRAVAPIMVEQGAGNIVNIGTDHVFTLPGKDVHGHGAMDLYNAAKWALNGFTLDWAISLKDKGVRVNCIHMGATDTEMLRGWIGDDITDEIVATWMKREDIAAVLIELLSEGPGGRTGQNLGMWVGRPISINDSTHVGARL